MKKRMSIADIILYGITLFLMLIYSEFDRWIKLTLFYNENKKEN